MRGENRRRRYRPRKARGPQRRLPELWRFQPAKGFDHEQAHTPRSGICPLSYLGGVGRRAQATRTWVSGVGDDVNPCSRTAPCKTFAGAISKTATNGEINCLDPGGFGAVTITKSITIDCGQLYGGLHPRREHQRRHRQRRGHRHVQLRGITSTARARRPATASASSIAAAVNIDDDRSRISASAPMAPRTARAYCSSRPAPRVRSPSPTRRSAATVHRHPFQPVGRHRHPQRRQRHDGTRRVPSNGLGCVSYQCNGQERD